MSRIFREMMKSALVICVLTSFSNALSAQNENVVDKNISENLIKNSDWIGNLTCNKNVNRSRFFDLKFEGKLQNGRLSVLPFDGRNFVHNSYIQFEKNNLWYLTSSYINQTVLWPLKLDLSNGRLRAEYNGKIFQVTGDKCELSLRILNQPKAKSFSEAMSEIFNSKTNEKFQSKNQEIRK